MNDQQWKEVKPAIARLHAAMMAVVFGAFGGFALFLATAHLVVQGGENVGQHLSLLGQFFPGYTVTWVGAFLGFAYGAISCGAAAFLVSWLYNTISLSRLDKR